MADSSTTRVLRKAFSDLMPATLDEISVELRPLSSEIPAVEKEWYDPERRTLLIVFKAKSPNTPLEEQEIDKQLALYFEPRTRQLSGFRFLDVDRNNIVQISHNLNRCFNEYLGRLTRKISETPKNKVEERLGLLSRWDTERRRASFFLNELPVAFTKKPFGVRFGGFELDKGAGELRKGEKQVRLQDQPLQILQILLEEPGKVISREELRQKIWPSDTFVEFDHGINNAIKRLREALGDTADTPRYIETIPHRGYRFIGKLERESPQT